MKKMVLIMMLILATGHLVFAAERKPIIDVSPDAFTTDTQVTLQGAGDNHLALAWWIPNEFWDAVLTRDPSTTEANKKAMMDAMAGVSLLAVVQADLTPLGSFQFYSKEAIEKEILIYYTNANEKKERIVPLKKIDSDLEVVLGVFKPILGAAMGNLGNNMHFYVLDDRVDSSTRRMDPYKEGKIDIQLTNKENKVVDASIELPLNCLFVPRNCPNGKEAHVSWKYCPWSGTRLQN